MPQQTLPNSKVKNSPTKKNNYKTKASTYKLNGPNSFQPKDTKKL